MRPRIFISHSAKEPAAGAFLDAFAERIEGEGFDVLLDRSRLHGGDDWFGCISNWVEYCHGAIVLFSPAAMASDFVFFEVSNLFHRWTHEQPGFPLLPVRLDGVPGDAFDGGRYGAIKFGQVQHVEGADVEATFAALKPKLDALRARRDLPETPFEKLEEQLVTLVSGCPVKFLRAAAGQAGADASGWTDAESPRRLARALMLTDFSGLFKAARELRRGLDAESVSDVFQLLAPNWVSRRAAIELSDLARRPKARCALVAGREVLFTPAMYARRAAAHLPGWSWEVAVVHGRVGAQDRCNLIEQVHGSLRDLFGLMEEDDEGELRRTLRRRERDGDPVVVGIALDAPLFAAIPPLQRRFPTVTFIVLCDEADAAGDAADWVLHPELSAARERWALEEYSDYKRRLDQAS